VCHTKLFSYVAVWLTSLARQCLLLLCLPTASEHPQQHACTTHTNSHVYILLQLRHQKPFSYVGLWPELSLINHSSCPNISTIVIKDRMLVCWVSLLTSDSPVMCVSCPCVLRAQSFQYLHERHQGQDASMLISPENV